MAQSHSVANTTIAAVTRARAEVNNFREQVTRLVRPDVPGEAANAARGLLKHIEHAEALVEKAELSVARIKSVGRVPPRPTASVPQTVRAKRALSVLQAGGMGGDGDASAKKKSRILPGGGVLAAGQRTATPMRSSEFSTTIKRAATASRLLVARVGPRGVGFECPNVFRAYVWFAEVDEIKEPRSVPPAAVSPALAPEHVSVFGIDELLTNRWSCSKHAVFNVLTERANAAVRYFQTREDSGANAFVALAEWLALHKTLFTDKCEDRRLAFDASRGIFLPACIRSFDGHGAPRFTRGSIPVRANSAQPTVRVPGNSASQASAAAHQSAQAAAAAARGGGAHPPGVSFIAAQGPPSSSSRRTTK